jgi:hypothetical protein
MPERLIVGIVEGLTFGIDAGDCVCRNEGSGDVPVFFFWVLIGVMAGVSDARTGTLAIEHLITIPTSLTSSTVT